MDNSRKPSVDWSQFLGPEALLPDDHRDEQGSFDFTAFDTNAAKHSPALPDLVPSQPASMLLSQSTKRKASQEVVHMAAPLRASKRGKDHKPFQDTIVINGEVYERRRRQSSPSPPSSIDAQMKASTRQVPQGQMANGASDFQTLCHFSANASNMQQSGLFCDPFVTPQRILKRQPTFFDIADFASNQMSAPLSSSQSHSLVNGTSNLALDPPSPTRQRVIRPMPNKLRQSAPASAACQPPNAPKTKGKSVAAESNVHREIVIEESLSENPPLPLTTITDLARDHIHELKDHPDLIELASSPATSALSPSQSSATSPDMRTSTRPKRNRKRQPPKGTPQPAMSSDANNIVHVARPPNAWILYRSDQLQILKSDPIISAKPQADISKLIGALWRSEKTAVKEWYEKQSQVKKNEHSRLHPGKSVRFPEYLLVSLTSRFKDYRFSPQRKDRAEKDDKEKDDKSDQKPRKKLARSLMSTSTMSALSTGSNVSEQVSKAKFSGLGLGRPRSRPLSVNDAVATPRNISPTFANAFGRGYDQLDSPMGSAAPVARFMPSSQGRRMNSEGDHQRVVSAGSNGSAVFNDAELQALIKSYTDTLTPNEQKKQVSTDPLLDPVLQGLDNYPSVEPSPQFASTDFMASQAWQDFLSPNGQTWLTHPHAEPFNVPPSLGIETPSSTISTPFSSSNALTPSWPAIDAINDIDAWLQTTDSATANMTWLADGGYEHEKGMPATEHDMGDFDWGQ